MDLTLFPRKLNGIVNAIPSKSQAHRYLICAAFADKQTSIVCDQTNQDIEATVACLNALGANITRTNNGYTVIPVKKLPQTALLPISAQKPPAHRPDTPQPEQWSPRPSFRHGC